MFSCIVSCLQLHVNVRFYCENRGVLNDFPFACWLFNVILLAVNLFAQSLKMRPKIAYDNAYFEEQNACSLVTFSKLIFKANFVSYGHPNGDPNGVQNCPTNGA